MQSYIIIDTQLYESSSTSALCIFTLPSAVMHVYRNYRCSELLNIIWAPLHSMDDPSKFMLPLPLCPCHHCWFAGLEWSTCSCNLHSWQYCDFIVMYLPRFPWQKHDSIKLWGKTLLDMAFIQCSSCAATLLLLISSSTAAAKMVVLCSMKAWSVMGVGKPINLRFYIWMIRITERALSHTVSARNMYVCDKATLTSAPVWHQCDRGMKGWVQLFYYSLSMKKSSWSQKTSCIPWKLLVSSPASCFTALPTCSSQLTIFQHNFATC